MIVLRIAAAGHPGQTECQLIVDGIGVIECAAFGILRATGKLEVTFFSKLRALGGFHYHTAGNALAVKRRRRSFHHINTFQEPRINLNGVIGRAIAQDPQAIEEGVVDVTAVETAQGNGVITRCAAGKVGEYAWRVVQCSVNRGGVLVSHLLTGHNRNGLTGGDQRLIRFGRTFTGFRAVTLRRSIGGIRRRGFDNDGVFSSH